MTAEFKDRIAKEANLAIHTLQYRNSISCSNIIVLLDNLRTGKCAFPYVSDKMPEGITQVTLFEAGTGDGARFGTVREAVQHRREVTAVQAARCAILQRLSDHNEISQINYQDWHAAVTAAIKSYNDNAPEEGESL